MSIPILNKRFDVIPKGAVYIGRPSPWGNPYTHLSNNNSRVPTTQVESRDVAVRAFREYAVSRSGVQPDWLGPLRYATALVCWCSPKSCHGQVLMELMRAPVEEPGTATR